MTRLMNLFGAACLSLALAACGGGGGNAGTSPFGAGPGSNGTTGASGAVAGGSSPAEVVAASVVALDIQRAGTSTTQISSTETAQAVATVTSGDGKPLEGVVVTFSTGVGPALVFAPVSATALTNATGQATLDVRASTPTSTGAATIVATATVANAAITGSRSIQISAGAVTGTAATPAALNFVSSTPSGTAIVIKGTGGNGRSESALLSFRVVDASNAPVNGATVGFALNASNGGAVLQQAQGVSNSDGLVTATVSSGNSPASIVVTATVGSTGVTTQSDTLIVSNSVPIEGGFEIKAQRDNLDGGLTGDSTMITAYVRDQFGNPVPDGIAVNFTTDFGAIGSSTLGGCTTVNGVCSVTFRVQNPRPVNDGIATVTGTVRVGSSTQLVQQLQLNMAAAAKTPYLTLSPVNGSTVTQLTLSSCKQSFELLLSDGSGHAPAAGTTIEAQFVSSNVTVGTFSGTPVLDQLLSGFPPVIYGFEVDVSSTALAPACVAGGTVQPSGQFLRLAYKTPGGIVFTQRIGLSYPQ